MPRERLNPAVLTDSYKASHFLQYPTAQLMVAYAEFRAPFDHDATDQRFVFYGLRYIIEEVISERWTEADVAAAERFFATHNAGHTPFAFPRDLFLAFIREYGGYFPVRIEALPEGTVAHPHVPVFLIFARHKSVSAHLLRLYPVASYRRWLMWSVRRSPVYCTSGTRGW